MNILYLYIMQESYFGFLSKWIMDVKVLKAAALISYKTNYWIIVGWHYAWYFPAQVVWLATSAFPGRKCGIHSFYHLIQNPSSKYFQMLSGLRFLKDFKRKISIFFSESLYYPTWHFRLTSSCQLLHEVMTYM